ncbi:MAG: hypothetical protein RLZ53_389 [Actinomycetota bacterium]|jgi:high-affinity iron transporter
MIANLLLGLREGLEASLVIGILIAYLTKVGRRESIKQVWLGVSVAVFISLIAGAVLTFGAYGLSFEAQETLGGVLSILAVGLVTWMILWLAQNAASLKGNIETDARKGLLSGASGIFMIALLAVGREGLETTLFIWAAVQAAGSTAMPLFGALLGITISVALGYFIYRGMVRINLSKFFTWTSGLLIIVSAGVLSYGIHDLQEAGLLPGLHSLAFELSEYFPQDSWHATLLKGLFNFSPNSTWLETIFWWLYVVTFTTIFIRITRSNRKVKN